MFLCFVCFNQKTTTACQSQFRLFSSAPHVGPLDVVTRPRLWLKTTSEKGPHLSCVVFTW